MPDLTTPLTDDELARLDEVLLYRFDDDDEADMGDEGIIDVTELDGFLTAIVSVPNTIVPSQWFPAVWGDYPPVLESDRELEQVFTWFFRHMKGSISPVRHPAPFVSPH